MMRSILRLLWALTLATLIVSPALGQTTLRAIKGAALTHLELDENFAGQYAQAAHGFSVGDFVYRTSSDTWALAQADAIGTVADGIVVAVESASVVWVMTKHGTITWSHGFGASGQVVWLSQSVAGDGTTTKPTSGIQQPLGVTISTTLFDFGGLGDLVEDVEEETHASEHSDGAADEIVATDLASACTDAQVLGGTTVVGGVECQTDDDTPESGDFGAATDLTAAGAVDADAVALGTDTTGGYAASTGEAGGATSLEAGALDALTEIASALCGTNEILEDQGASWACISTPTGGSGDAVEVEDGDDGGPHGRRCWRSRHRHCDRAAQQRGARD
jgi:hypothetical protein